METTEQACAAENVDDGGKMVTQENFYANLVHHQLPHHHVNVLVNQPSDEEILFFCVTYTHKKGDTQKEIRYLNEKKNKFI